MRCTWSNPTIYKLHAFHHLLNKMVQLGNSYASIQQKCHSISSAFSPLLQNFIDSFHVNTVIFAAGNQTWSIPVMGDATHLTISHFNKQQNTGIKLVLGTST